MAGVGERKHKYRAGVATNDRHFTGRTRGKRVRRNGLTRRQRRLKRRTHVNKYGQ